MSQRIILLSALALISPNYAFALRLTTNCSPENIPPVDPSVCCDLNDIMSQDIVKECKLRFSDNMRQPSASGELFPTGCCFSECFLNRTEVLKNGAIDSALAIKYLTDKIPDARMSEVIRNAVQTCLSDVMLLKSDFDLIADLPPPPNGQRICNPLSGHFIGCVHSNLFRNCPQSRWVPSQECEGLREYFNKCPLPFPMRA